MPKLVTRDYVVAIRTVVSHRARSSATVVLLFGEYVKENYSSRIYGRGMNMRRLLAKEYEDALEKYNVVVMPTIPMTALKLIEKDPSITDYLVHTDGNAMNTMAANVTGMPAMSVNAGFIDGLPVGAMFTAKKFDEVTLFKVGHFFEKLNKQDV